MEAEVAKSHGMHPGHSYLVSVRRNGTWNVWPVPSTTKLVGADGREQEIGEPQ